MSKTHRTLQIRANLRDDQEFSQAEIKHINLLAKLLIDGFGRTYTTEDELLLMAQDLAENFGFEISEFVVAAQVVLDQIEHGDIPRHSKQIILMTTFFPDAWKNEILEKFKINQESRLSLRNLFK